MRLLCFLRLHAYGAWGHIQEIPIWRTPYPDIRTALGNQPTKEQLYKKNNVIVKEIEPNLDFLLVGKLTEQRCQCTRPGCGYTKVSYQRFKI